MTSMPIGPPKDRVYVVISPVCNEVGHVDGFIDSVVKQTLPPRLWIIVDDGSTDGTLEALRRRCDPLGWIKVVNRPIKGHVGLDGGEDWAAMQDGFSHLEGISYTYIVKLDGDVILEPNYFELLMQRCEQDSSLGMVSGSCWETRKGRTAALRTIAGSCWPPARLYRRSCFDSVSAHEPVLGWDMLHVIRARARGWQVGAFYKPSFLHRRKMGSRGGLLRGKFRYGRTSWLLGYSPAYFALRLIYQLAQYPPLLGSMAMLCGYLKSRLSGEPLIVNDDEKVEMRRMQRASLSRGFHNQDHTALGYLKDCDFELNPESGAPHGDSASARSSRIVRREK